MKSTGDGGLTGVVCGRTRSGENWSLESRVREKDMGVTRSRAGQIRGETKRKSRRGKKKEVKGEKFKYKGDRKKVYTIGGGHICEERKELMRGVRRRSRHVHLVRASSNLVGKS